MLRRYRIRLADGSEERAAAIHTATVNERTRIARDIHDNVGHLLTRAIMQAEAGRLVAEAARGFAQIHDTADQAMTMIRRSVHDLEDDGTDFTAQIHAAAHAFDGAADFDVRLCNDIRTAPAPVARCLSAVIREAVSNVAHHSDAAQVSVLLREFPALWQLTVQDDGGRTPHAKAAAPRGMGLADIEARVRALGGTALCGPFNDGWRVFASTAEVLWTANNGTDAVERYRSGPHHRPDVLLLDIQMPGVSGLDTARRILAFDHAARILFLTTFSDRAYIDEAIAIGARGYLIKQDVSAVAPALQAVMAGQVVLGAEVLGKLTEERPHRHDGDVPSNPFPNLSDRERDIAALVAQGLDNRDIASRLCLSEGTVRNRISGILDKLGMTNRTQLAIAWLKGER